MVETNQLVAQSVYIATKPSLSWQHIFVVVDVLIEEGAILELLVCVVKC